MGKKFTQHEVEEMVDEMRELTYTCSVVEELVSDLVAMIKTEKVKTRGGMLKRWRGLVDDLKVSVNETTRSLINIIDNGDIQDRQVVIPRELIF